MRKGKLAGERTCDCVDDLGCTAGSAGGVDNVEHELRAYTGRRRDQCMALVCIYESGIPAGWLTTQAGAAPRGDVVGVPPTAYATR